jgi:serine protease Do
MLALAMLVVSFFGGAAFGRFTNYGSLPNIGGEPNNNNNTPGSGNGNGNQTGIPGINRGDVVLNVIERDPAEYGERDIPAVVAKVQDTVVEIRTETTVTSAYYGDYVQSGAGSGVIVSQDGLILTCDHVITGAGTITVVLTDGREFVAEVYGEDSWSDLALIKIDATGLPAAEMPAAATKDDVTYKSYLAVGEEVIAIGNPLGELGGSVSNGIISALGRNVNVEGVPMTLMQTNAAVNPGNSGGGLFNMYGELIGIVNAKSTGDSVEGIGFAIPVSDAIVIYKQLYSQGYVSGRPYLGLYFEETTNGLKIISYDYNSELPEGKSIQNGDMLYSVDGKVITSFSGLKNVLAKKKVGDTVVIQIERYERRGYSYVRIPLELTITVHEYIPVQGN